MLVDTGESLLYSSPPIASEMTHFQRVKRFLCAKTLKRFCPLTPHILDEFNLNALKIPQFCVVLSVVRDWRCHFPGDNLLIVFSELRGPGADSRHVISFDLLSSQSHTDSSPLVTGDRSGNDRGVASHWYQVPTQSYQFILVSV